MRARGVVCGVVDVDVVFGFGAKIYVRVLPATSLSPNNNATPHTTESTYTQRT
jgi:hypothetical protein